MTCPDWKRLAARRAALATPFASHSPAGEAGETEWQQALAHLDSGCPVCRRAALAADPLLVFRRLPAPEMSVEREEDEVADMQRAVAAMRTASRLEGPARGSVDWRRWAAAAALTFLALSANPWRTPGERPAPPAPAQAFGSAGAAGRPSALAVEAARAEGNNTVEAVENRPDARVYQMDGDGITVAMIVDESLEL